MLDMPTVSTQLRKMTCELGNLSRPDGAVTFCQGDTCVNACLYGPGDVRMSKELLDKATVEVVYKPVSYFPSCQGKSLEDLLCGTFKNVLLVGAHPRSSIGLTVQEVQNSGSFIATCVNAVCLSMIDASVEMRYTAAAVNCCIEKNGNIILDPSMKQEEESKAILTYVFECREKKVITFSAQGTFTAEDLDKCSVLCKEASTGVFNYYRDCMRKKMSKTV